VTHNAPDQISNFRHWASGVLEPGYRPRHEYRRVGHLPAFVLEDQVVSALNPAGTDLHISDMQLLHARRNTKVARGAALTACVVLDLPNRLEAARWVFDAAHRGLIAFFDAEVAGHVGKAVIHFNHVRRGTHYNAVVTMGLVQPENENARVYRALRPKT